MNILLSHILARVGQIWNIFNPLNPLKGAGPEGPASSDPDEESDEETEDIAKMLSLWIQPDLQKIPNHISRHFANHILISNYLNVRMNFYSGPMVFSYI